METENKKVYFKENDWNQILPLYIKFFHYARICGAFPYKFNSETLELSAISSGFSYYLFLFNTLYISIQICKLGLLFFLNWWTDFEFEYIQGGYFIQLCWLMGLTMVYAIMFGYVFERIDFASTISACIRLERRLVTGKNLICST